MSRSNFLNIVLYQPEIPQNSGNIARMCAANNLRLHFIEPLGFSLEDKYLQRAAMDYWEHLDYVVHKSWTDFKANVDLEQNKIWLLSSKVKTSFWDVEYQTGDYLLFGSEGSGVPEELMQELAETSLTVPMSNSDIRCLNLASTVQTVYYEAFRQLH